MKKVVESLCWRWILEYTYGGHRIFLAVTFTNMPESWTPPWIVHTLSLYCNLAHRIKNFPSWCCSKKFSHSLKWRLHIKQLRIRQVTPAIILHLSWTTLGRNSIFIASQGCLRKSMLCSTDGIIGFGRFVQVCQLINSIYWRSKIKNIYAISF